MGKTIVAKQIRKIIAEQGVKHKVISNRAGYTEQQFSDILNGRRIIRDVDVFKIAEALGVTPNVLYGIEEK